MVSGDRFVATAAESAALRDALPDALAVEMEGAAVAQVCADFGCPCAVMCIVSDRADDAAQGDFTSFVNDIASDCTMHRRARGCARASSPDRIARPASMTHRRAVAAMVAVTLMWSIAGVVTRHLDAARAFEITFWRSLFNAFALALMLLWLRGPWMLAWSLKRGGRTLWLSGACWSVMFTAFMVAITLTTVANVLVTMRSPRSSRHSSRAWR